VTALRVRELWQTLTRPTFFLGATTSFLAMLLLGMCVGRWGVLENVAAHHGLLKRAFWWCLAGGMAGTLVYASWTLATTASLPSRMAYNLVGLRGCILQGLSYAAGVALLAQQAWWRPKLAHLASLGRMTLAHFLLQFLILRLLFDRFFLGLKLGPTAGMAIVAVVLTVQIFVSAWWLRRSRSGPVEQLWRTLTYGAQQRSAALARSA
jgi:uncharacterized protein